MSRERGKYRNGMRYGLWEEFYHDGTIHYKGEYRDNIHVGIWTEYHYDGTIKRQLIPGKDFSMYIEGDEIYGYKVGRGGVLIKLKIFSEDITDSFEGYMFNHIHARFKTTKAQIISITSLETGKKLEQVQSLTNPGVVYKLGKTFTGGELPDFPFDQSDKSIEFHKSREAAFGSKFPEWSYTGPFKMFYPNGRIKMEGMYREGVKIGVWTEYNQDGSIEQKIKYDENGHGCLKVWPITGYKLGRGGMMMELEIRGPVTIPLKKQFDEQYATFQTTEAKVVSITSLIYVEEERELQQLKDSGSTAENVVRRIKFIEEKHLKETKELDETWSITNGNVSYKRGETFTANKSPDLPNGWGPKFIEFHKSKEAAFGIAFPLWYYTGPFKRYYMNGRIEIEGEYEEKKCIGTWNFYDRDGNVIGRILYDQDGNIIEKKGKTLYAYFA